MIYLIIRMKKLYSYIRFSTPEQLKGDSLRRQMELAKDYADQHNLELTQVSDQGVSAFRGKNLEKGNLGRFVQLVNDGKIEEGSTLLIESFDRLSRQGLSDAVSLFLQIINAGVVVVTLADGGKEYTKESIDRDMTDLLISLTIMSRANEESRTKSARLQKSWAERRKSGKPLTSVCQLRISEPVKRTNILLHIEEF